MPPLPVPPAPASAPAPMLCPAQTCAITNTVNGHTYIIGLPVGQRISGGTTSIVAVVAIPAMPPQPDPRYVVKAWTDLNGHPIEVTFRMPGETGFFKGDLQP